MTDEGTLIGRISDNVHTMEISAVGLFHEKDTNSSRHEQYRNALDTAVEALIRDYVALQRTLPSHPAVALAKAELDRLSVNSPAENITLWKVYKSMGLTTEARNAIERAAKHVDPAFWDDVADMEMKLGNVQRAHYIWNKIIQAWDAKGEYWYALRFARKLGDDTLIAKYEGLAARTGK